MSELRDRLERLGERAPSAPDAFERLERARRRHERNRRITAGTVALLVAIAGSVAAFTAFTGSEPQAAGEPDDGFVAIWPESTYEEALEVQERVDAGDPSVAWRLDAHETALVFARDVLGWSDVAVAMAPDDLRVELLVRSPGGPCGSPPEPACDPREVAVELAQLDGASSGIWSVISVRSPEFEGGPEAGSEIVAGEQLDIVARGSAASVNLYVAFVGLGPCAGWEHDGVMAGPRLVVVAPRPPDGDAEACPVALVVLHNDPADQDAQGLGRQLLEYGYRTSLDGVLVVPLSLVPGASDSVPDIAHVTCEGANIAVDTSVVAAQPDGIHIEVTTVGDTPVAFRVAEDTGSDAAVSSRGRGSSEPTGEVVLLSAPGRYVLSCTTSQKVAVASLDVVDPNGSFVPAEPECSGGDAWGTAPAYAPGAHGDEGDPVEIARMRLSGLQDGDVVERAGYPHGDGTAIVRVVRDGTVIAKAELFDDGQGGWLLSSMEGCGDAPFGWSSGVSGPTGSSRDLCEPPSTDLLIVVDEGEFVSDTGCVSAPAGASLTITLDNRDSSGHNISIYPRGSDEPLFRGDVCFGPDHITYLVPTLEAGRYRLVDDIHPDAPEMTLVVT